MEAHSSFVFLSSVSTISIASDVSPAQKKPLTQLCPTPTPWTLGNALIRSSSSCFVVGLPTWTVELHA